MTLDTIKRRVSDAGGHWFEAATMRFFQSRVSPKIYPVGPDEAFFVSSERRWEEPRLYTVRRYAAGKIETIGEFQGHESSRSAHKVAGSLARAIRNG